MDNKAFAYRTLWLDDEPYRIEAMKLYAETELNIGIDLASTTDTAVERLKVTDYDLFVTDLYLWEGDPYESLDFIKTIRDGTLGKELGKPLLKEIPICVCSAANANRYPIISTDENMHLLRKPFDYEHLERLFESVFDRKFDGEGDRPD